MESGVREEWRMAIVFSIIGIACICFPGYAAISALRSGETRIKMKYRPGRIFSREGTPFSFWLGVSMQAALGLFGLVCLVISGVLIAI